MNGQRTEYFECTCYSDEHTLRFSFDDTDPNEREVYVSIFLSEERRWYKRVWTAIKFVFGYKCKYGHWDNFVMQDNDVERLQELLKTHQLTNPKKLAVAAQAFENWANRVKTDLEKKGESK